MESNITYVGLDNDEYGGMSALGGIVKDAWVFGVIPESETCAGWTQSAMRVIYEHVREQWERVEYSVDLLPQEMRERHERIHQAAISKALEMGWEPEQHFDAE
jgi:hypothetical protein